MDFSKLSQNEKLALYGSIAVIVGAAAGGSVSGLGWLALLAAIAMVAVVLLPAFSPGTNLPGSKGSLMVILGGIAGAIMLLALVVSLQFLGAVFGFAPISAILFLIAVAGGLLMAWAGWQEFQSEGGKLQVGGTATGSAQAAAPPATPSAQSTAPPQATPAATPPPATSAAPPAAPPAETMAPRDTMAPPDTMAPRDTMAPPSSTGAAPADTDEENRA